jgi:hypothetical protein
MKISRWFTVIKFAGGFELFALFSNIIIGRGWFVLFMQHWGSRSYSTFSFLANSAVNQCLLKSLSKANALIITSATYLPTTQYTQYSAIFGATPLQSPATDLWRHALKIHQSVEQTCMQRAEWFVSVLNHSLCIVPAHFKFWTTETYNIAVFVFLSEICSHLYSNIQRCTMLY